MDDLGMGLPDEEGYMRRQLVDGQRRLMAREVEVAVRERTLLLRERRAFALGVCLAVAVLWLSGAGGCGWWPFPVPQLPRAPQPAAGVTVGGACRGGWDRIPRDPSPQVSRTGARGFGWPLG